MAERFHLKRRMLDAVNIGERGTCRIEHGVCVGGLAGHEMHRGYVHT